MKLTLLLVNNPENTVFPLLHFEAVGHLIDSVRWERMSDAAKIFYRVAIESYIYHVAILAMFYPQTNRYATLSSTVQRMLRRDGSGPEVNMIISLDVDIYLILFELTILSRTDRYHIDFPARLAAIRTKLTGVLDRATAHMSTIPTTEYEEQFWKLTYVACLVLQIFFAKVQTPAILATAEEIKRDASMAFKVLGIVQIRRTWTGNLVWILTLLLCAASTPSDVEQIETTIDQIKQGLWGSDLLRIQQVVRLVRQKRRQLDRSIASSGNVILPEHYDTLSILLNQNGILG